MLLGLDAVVFVLDRFEVLDVGLVDLVGDAQLAEGLHLLQVLQTLLHHCVLVEVSGRGWHWGLVRHLAAEQSLLRGVQVKRCLLRHL